jgi:SpoVK/Ycf46/Vps4 family AAA+-type ATPase
VLFEAPNEKVAMNMALKRLDRMDIETLVAVPAEEGNPTGPV